MKTADIRSAFLKFFERNGHTIVPSSSLVPANDPTLLFTNAGMNQFKDVFLGLEKRPYTRATSSQRCVRAGGKHNDLENVGYTARHHTFFEMLGNFSFGDYFKEDAIRFAWTFLTEELGLPKEKLWVTVHHSDQEAEDIWLNQIGVDPNRFSRLGDKDNFWQMGDTGPCGPCTEIFFDHGPDVWGGPPGSPEEDGDRYIEIWNLVFMQFNQQKDGTREPLPKPSVDTGMGLERIAAVMQGVHSNYEIDLFQSILGAASELLGGVPTTESSLRVIADHIRSCSFLIADGVMPSNDGRGYTLRRIIRRAIRHGHKLGAREPFFHKLVPALCDAMGEAYPELVKAQDMVQRVLLLEEEQFAKTLDKGMRLLEEDIEKLDGKVIPGKTVFTLYDTYGFPVDLTNDIARERNLTLDMEGYEAAMAEQRERARAASKFDVDYNAAIKVEGKTVFTGYEALAGSAHVVALVNAEGQQTEQLAEGEKGLVVLDETPFYGESGGQVGDTGTLTSDAATVEVVDTQKQGELIVHHVVVKSGTLRNGDTVNAEVDRQLRKATALNHSATHLLHAALRKVLGEHVQQKGSLVNAQRLRFDFAHFEAVTPEELEKIQALVNQQIRANTPVTTTVTDMDSAREMGAMALFGEKYGDTVRVLSMGEDNFSVELCGGTHVSRTGDIGTFIIVSEAGISAGVRRIEALTGVEAEKWIARSEATLRDIAALVKGSRDNLAEKVHGLFDRQKELEKEIERLKGKLASAAGADLASQAETVGDARVLVASLEGADRKALMDTADQLKNKLKKAVVLLATVEGDKVVLVAGVTQDLTSQIKAGDLIREVAPKVGGKGGGRPDMAQGGGTDAQALPGALEAARDWIRSLLS
ncbi:MAG: alanine--tRNA ligase [Gammaproteobacteria bacterium]|nr:MAG: alanine--tRNA ligase [Gammaproteobacteria bacterium]